MESNYKWPTLLMKYMGGKITQKEMQEIERQMVSSPLKREQFERYSNPDNFINQLKAHYYINTDHLWKKLVDKLPFLKTVYKNSDSG